MCVLLLSEFEFDCIENGEDGWMLLSWHWRAPIASNFDKSAHTHTAESVQFNTKPSSTTIKTGYIISCIYVLDSSVDKIKAVLYALSLFSSNDGRWMDKK